MLPGEIAAEVLHSLDAASRECLRLVSRQFNSAFVSRFKESPPIRGEYASICFSRTCISFKLDFGADSKLAAHFYNFLRSKFIRRSNWCCKQIRKLFARRDNCFTFLLTSDQ